MLRPCRQLQPQAGTTTTKHLPGCSLLSPTTGMADPEARGQLQFPPAHKRHWAALTLFCLSIMSLGPGFHTVQIGASLLTSMDGTQEAEEDWQKT